MNSLMFLKYFLDRPYHVKLVFDMVDRVDWDSNVFSIGSTLISSNVRNIYIMQTNGIECHSYMDCVALIREMKVILPIIVGEGVATS